jgi:hypothetical protein
MCAGSSYAAIDLASDQDLAKGSSTQASTTSFNRACMSRFEFTPDGRQEAELGPIAFPKQIAYQILLKRPKLFRPIFNYLKSIKNILELDKTSLPGFFDRC